MHVLVLEASTTSAKAMLHDLDGGPDNGSPVSGGLVESSPVDGRPGRVRVRPYPPMLADPTLHDPQVVVDTVVAVGRELLDQFPGLRRDIAMIALGGAWHSVLLCDTDLEPVTPVLPWSFTGASDLCAVLRADADYVDEFAQRTGCMVNAIYPYFKLQLLREQGYDLAAHRIVGQGTFLFHRLTGTVRSSAAMASGSGLLNIHDRTWDETLLASLGIGPEQLGELTGSDAAAPLTAEAAARLGLPAGIPVLPANPDGGLNQLGAGALEEGVMTFSVGTSGALRLSTSRPLISPSHATWCYLSPGGWLSGAATNGACNCVDWFRRSLPQPSSYRDLEAAASGPDSTPVFLPFLFGERCPGWDDERTGGFTGLRPQHTVADLYLGLQEGILFNLLQCFRALVDAGGDPHTVMLSGGILNSARWTQMAADIFARPMHVTSLEHASLLGGAILAGHALGRIGDLKDFTPTVERVIDPDPATAGLYEHKMERYLAAYDGRRVPAPFDV